MHTGQQLNPQAAAQRAYERLIDVDLPLAGQDRGWPWTRPAEFRRLLHEHAGSDADSPDMLGVLFALELGEAMLKGQACPRKLRAKEVQRHPDEAGRHPFDADDRS